MEINKKLIGLLFLTLTCYSQSNKDMLEIVIDQHGYEKIAKDTIKAIFYKQKEHYFNNRKEDIGRTTALSSLYSISELQPHSVPIFRIKRDASTLFSCDSAIEKFIQWEERIKYEYVIIEARQKIICDLYIPDFNYELERIYNPFEDTSIYRNNKNYYIDRLQEDPNNIINEKVFKIMNERKENFYFMIFGLKYILFEIEKSTGVIYANWVYVGMNPPRLPANEFIQTYVGLNKIQELGKGNYIDIDEKSQPIKPCNLPPANGLRIRIK